MLGAKIRLPADEIIIVKYRIILVWFLKKGSPSVKELVNKENVLLLLMQKGSRICSNSLN